MKKILLFLSVLFLPLFVNAEDVINNFNVDIYIDNNGNAHVTELWDTKADDGSEFYRSYYNYTGSEFKDYKVEMDGKEYTFIDSWDIDASLSEKAYKNGFNYVDNGIEICFGKSSLGTHKYISKYTITNFVRRLNDSDMLYWTILPYNNGGKFKNVGIKIHSNFKYKSDIELYSYGKGGMPLTYENGVIKLDSNGALSDNEYITILVKFDEGTFNLSNKIDNDFNYYLDMANKDAVKYEKKSRTEKIFAIIMIASGVVFFGGVVGICIYASDIIGGYKLDFGKDGKKLDKNLPNYRDIPCNKDIFKAYFISTSYNLTKRKTDLFGAILLKWIKDGTIETKKINDTDLALVLKGDILQNKTLQKLYDMLKEASKDGILESKEFERWCKIHSEKVMKWFDEVLKEEGEKLVKDKYLTIKEKKNVFPVKTYVNGSNVGYGIKAYVNDSYKEEGKKLYGLKKYLIEFSRIKEKEPIEVKLWDEYLMYAQIFGIAKEVAKQFKKLYPEIIENTDYDFDYDTFIFVNAISNTSMTTVTSYSSSGGGSGSFGGGGGGGAGGR